MTTCRNELAGSTTSAPYSPPYNSAGQADESDRAAEVVGVRIPVDSTQCFVIQPLQKASFSDSTLGPFLSTWQGTSRTRPHGWTPTPRHCTQCNRERWQRGRANRNYGPLPVMMSNLLGVAQAGGLDGLLMISSRFTRRTTPSRFCSSATERTCRAWRLTRS